MHTSVETPCQTSSLISAHPTCKDIQTLDSSPSDSWKAHSCSQVSTQTVGNPNQSSPCCQGNASGFTFSGSGVDARRKTCAGVITKETRFFRLQRGWGGWSRVHSPGRGSAAAPSASNSRNLERRDTFRSRPRWFSTANPWCAPMSDIPFLNSCSDERDSKFSSSLSARFFFGGGGFVELLLWVLPWAGRIQETPSGICGTQNRFSVRSGFTPATQKIPD